MKMGPVKIIVRGLLAALLTLLAVGCSEEKPVDPKAAVEVELGKAFTWNEFTVADGWTVEASEQNVDLQAVDRPYIVGEVTNEADEPRFSVFEFIFVADGKLQSTIRCTSEKIPAGETTGLGCPGFQDMPTGYDLIQVREITR